MFLVMNMSKKYFFIGTILLCAMIGGLILAGIRQGYFSGKDDSSVTVSVSPARIFAGTITAVDLENLQFTLAVGGNMALDPALAERTVRLTKETVIVREKEKKDPQVFASEVESYGMVLRELSGLSEEEANQKLSQVAEPEEYVLESVPLEVLTSGMRVFVFTDHDVMEEKEFDVQKIRIFYKN